MDIREKIYNNIKVFIGLALASDIMVGGGILNTVVYWGYGIQYTINAILCVFVMVMGITSGNKIQLGNLKTFYGKAYQNKMSTLCDILYLISILWYLITFSMYGLLTLYLSVFILSLLAITCLDSSVLDKKL